MFHDWDSRYADLLKDCQGYTIGKQLNLLTDPEIISLAGGLPSPDVFLKDEVRQISKRCLEDDIDRIMQYTRIQGEPAFVEAINQFLKRDNIEASEENILVTNSGQHGLDIVGRLFLNPGDTIIMDRPTFAGAIVAFRMEHPVFVGVDIQEDGSDIDTYRSAIIKLIDEGRKPKFIYVVPDFQNPSGITMSLEKRLALLDLSEEFKVPIVEDSPYRDLRYYGENVPSIYSLDQQRGGAHVIGLYTFSKLFCPGFRIGFNIAPKQVIEMMLNIKEGNVLNTPKYNQDICTAFLSEMNLEGHLEHCRNYYREKLDTFMTTMESLFPAETGVSWTRPEGGLFVWVTLPEHINTDELLYEAVRHKVAFVPGSAFYGENPETNHMRINFSYPSIDQLNTGLERLANCIKGQL
ncbi:PLP-dependent aminotransferase family protein [bacterium]|nr:PLP-dependent aminotransferase family protein [bacterium]